MIKEARSLPFYKSTYSPFSELVAYEYLWSEKGASFKTIADILTKQGILPSNAIVKKYGFFLPDQYKTIERYIKKIISNSGRFSILLKEDAQYPKRLLDAKYPIDLFYYRGDLGLLESRCISVVGTRQVSSDGMKRTKKVTTLLVKEGYTVVSGLARGVDTIALTTALEKSGNVIAVIGTPITEYYPRENHELQERIANTKLLISQVPIYRYNHQSFDAKRSYFPARNITMAAIAEATVIVEASDTSGTLIQARACIEQGKKLFILNSCFENRNISWPEKYEAKGAIRIKDIDDLLQHLSKLPHKVELNERFPLERM